MNPHKAPENTLWTEIQRNTSNNLNIFKYHDFATSLGGYGGPTSPAAYRGRGKFPAPSASPAQPSYRLFLRPPDLNLKINEELQWGIWGSEVWFAWLCGFIVVWIQETYPRLWQDFLPTDLTVSQNQKLRVHSMSPFNLGGWWEPETIGFLWFPDLGNWCSENGTETSPPRYKCVPKKGLQKQKTWPQELSKDRVPKKLAQSLPRTLSAKKTLPTKKKQPYGLQNLCLHTGVTFKTPRNSRSGLISVDLLWFAIEFRV